MTQIKRAKSTPSGRSKPVAWSNVVTARGVAFNPVSHAEETHPDLRDRVDLIQIASRRRRVLITTFAVHGVSDRKLQNQLSKTKYRYGIKSRSDLYIRRLELQGILVQNFPPERRECSYLCERIEMGMTSHLVIATAGSGQPNCDPGLCGPAAIERKGEEDVSLCKRIGDSKAYAYTVCFTQRTLPKLHEAPCRTVAYSNRVFDHSAASPEPWWNERLDKIPSAPLSLTLPLTMPATGSSIGGRREPARLCRERGETFATSEYASPRFSVYPFATYSAAKKQTRQAPILRPNSRRDVLARIHKRKKVDWKWDVLSVKAPSMCCGNERMMAGIVMKPGTGTDLNTSTFKSSSECLNDHESAFQGPLHTKVLCTSYATICSHWLLDKSMLHTRSSVLASTAVVFLRVAPSSAFQDEQPQCTAPTATLLAFTLE
ncbi:hypothetical protein F5141DRAFT_1065470 [Pisolithus sp. B1]|nr:hypothetical protein F5141DRAFT_1065470 [Pisolithus sp. B1]